MKVLPVNETSDRMAGSDLDHAVRVLQIESEALHKLAESLDSRFCDAVEAVHEMKGRNRGRLIVAGIGKSGHVARKMAATLASTGTPSFFVHPGEASHGDMGMVTENDVVLMLSNSGENAELSDLIAYTRRYGIKLIAMTGNANSSLSKHSDITLLLPPMPEACPNGLAPTTSTTMMIALGDAFAVALLERMGLTPEQYKVFHPGGKLGQKLLKISEIMHQGDSLPLVRDTAMMDEALLVMTEKNLGSLLVVDESGALSGIITDGDLKRHMGPELLQKPVTEVMSSSPKTIEVDALAVEALDLMLNRFDQPLTSIVVLEDGKLAGLIRVQDCLQAGLA